MTHLGLKIIGKKSKVIELTVANSWADLNQAQLLYIADNWQAWDLLFKNNVSVEFARAKLFINLIIDKSARELKKIAKYLSHIDNHDQLEEILSIGDFVFKKIQYTKNLLPTIKIGWFKKLHGPADELANTCINEFSFCIGYYNSYNRKKEEKYLDLLVACLYRDSYKNWEDTGDIRKPFNNNTADKYLEEIAKLSFAIKMAVYLFFHCSIDLFSKRFPLVFSRGEESSASPDNTFLDIILKLSGGKFGSFNETKDQNAFLVLKELNTLLLAAVNKPKN